MNFKKVTWILAFVVTTLLLVALASCSMGQKSFKEETVTAANKAEIAGKANTELTVEEARLLRQYLRRSYPDLTENDLPIGRTLDQMIEEERTIESTSPAQQAAQQAEAVPAETAAVPAAETPAPASRPAPARTTPAQTPAAEPASRQPASPAVPAPGENVSPQQAQNLGGSSLTQAGQPAAEPVAIIPETPKPIVVEIPAETALTVRLVEGLSTETAQSGDRFELELAEDLNADGHLIAAKGTRARGRVISSQPAGKVKGLATISLTLTDLYIEDEQYPLQAETLTYQAEKTTGKDAAKVGVGAGIGALLGAIIGGGKGAAIGAGVGAGAGTTTVLATKGDELVFPVEQMFRFRLNKGFKVEVLEE